MTLNIRALRGLFFVLIVLGALLFLPAGTLDFWQAWTFLVVFGLSGLIITVYLMKKNPELLEKRIHGGPTAEKEPTQKVIVSIATFGFFLLLIVSALDHRFQWSTVPDSLAIGGDILFLLGWTIIFFVFKENTFASATIELASDQKVISTGPYALVRHPMYGGSILYLVGMPIALGSWWGMLGLLFMVPAIIWRLIDEEKFLMKSLPGYAEYQDKVKYRLVPFVW